MLEELGDGGACLLGYPVHCECHENKQSNDLSRAAASHPSVARWVAARLVFDIYSDQCHRIPSPECGCKNASDERHKIYMAVFLRHIDSCPQHKNGERDAWNPADEANDVEDREDEEDDPSRPVFTRQHVDGGHEAEHDIEDARYPCRKEREVSTLLEQG